MTLFTISFFCLITYISAMDSCHIPQSLQICGVRRPKDTEFCCNNETYSKNSKLCCCIDTINGTQIVHTEEMICCGGQLHNKTDSFGEQQDCCGAELYRKSDPNKMCCRPRQDRIDRQIALPRLHCDNPHVYPNWETSQCCGNEVMNPETQKCCDDTINTITGNRFDWFCCNKTTYNHRSHKCNHDDPYHYVILPVYNNQCDGKRYDRRLNTCCNDILHPFYNEKQFSCCGSQILNIETQQCCNKTLSLVISKSRVCCGSLPTGIDGSVQRCCINPLDPSTNLVHSITTQAEHCCGSSLYNIELQFCCRGTSYLKSQYKLCGNPKECVVVSPQAECCGVHELHTHSHTCCEKRLPVVKTSGGQDKCCYNHFTQSGESYVSETQQCVVGKVEVKANRCVNEEYDENSDLCCTNVLFRGAADMGKSCCGYEVVDESTQRCCSFRAFNGTECPEPPKKPICHNLCTKNRREVAEKINYGEFDSAICRLKLAYVAEVRRQTVNFDEDSMKYVIRRPSRNLFNRRLEIRHKYLLLSCTCKKNFPRLIVITSNPQDKTRELSRFEKDIVLPYSKRITRAIKQRKNNVCNNDIL